MTDDKTNNKQQIQAAVRAAFSTTLVPTDVAVTTIDMPSPLLVEPHESSAEASDKIAEAPPLPEHDENLVEAKDEIAEVPSWVEHHESLAGASREVAQEPALLENDKNPLETRDEIAKWVCEVRNSTERTLELSKRLDDLLARPIRWFHESAADKSTAVQSEPN